jgi:MYXO-CTERM domain-containing protein
MIRTLFICSILGASTAAVAGETEVFEGKSNDEDILFTGNGQLFNGIEYDTGVYTIIDDAGVRFFVDADADFSFEMEGRSSLEWPDALSHSWDQTDNGGTVLINTTTDIVAQVAGDIYGIAFTYNIWSETISWEGVEDFNSILMPKARQPSANIKIPGTDFYSIQETVEVAEGLTITLGGKIYPQLDANITGVSIDSGDAVVHELKETALLGVPKANPGYTAVDSIWNGVLSGNISLRIVPWISVYYADWGMEFGPIQYDIPINLFDDTADIQSDKARFNHDLPAIQTNLVSIDFGEISLGSVAKKEIQINNLGEVKLDGEALTDGGLFFVSDALISAPKLSRDAVTVEFIPTEAGTFQGELVLNTNDPVRPQLVVPLVGTAVDGPVTNPGDGNGERPNIAAPVGCGCTVAPVGGAPLGLLSLLGAGFFIRRRRF